MFKVRTEHIRKISGWTSFSTVAPGASIARSGPSVFSWPGGTVVPSSRGFRRPAAPAQRGKLVHHVPRDVGWIEVICGSMFSGKTEELIRRLRRAQYARQKIQSFKPAIDDRYTADRIASHDDRTLECVPVAAVREIPRLLHTDTEVVGIDEAQFFTEGLVETCEGLAGRGIRVIAAALDQDFRGEPFGEIPRLMAVAEFVTKNLAICVRCGNPANRSQRLRGTGDTIQVGAGDAYEPRCRACFRPEVIGQEQIEIPGR